MLSIYAPLTALLTVVFWAITALITKYSSLGAIVSFSIMPVIMLFLDSGEKFPVAFLLAMILIIRHRDNIRRIIKGTEPKIGRRS
jgi:glycerol-3-phosphate acyltransferase PlsY